MIKEFNLIDIPYNVAGKIFPKRGVVKIGEDNIEYRFHGRGCTLYWSGLEIFFNVDSTSTHQIIITPGGLYCFLETFFIKYFGKVNSEEVDNILEKFEEKGVLMMRKPTDKGNFHVNEEWYKAYLNNLPFTGNNKDMIDWL